MKKGILFTLAIICINASIYSQNRLIDRSAKVSFYSEAALEDIEATTSQALGVLDLDNNKVAVSILMKSFNFEKALMQEHFNENYVESDKFPKATFSGVFDSPVDFSKEGTVEAQVSGKLTIHGVTKDVTNTVTMVISETSISASTSFMVKVEEYKIKIPKVVVTNIAEEVEVKASFNFDR
ncbi:MAG: YceI family protein [Cyclobacteriaceae bacterium]